MPRVVHLSIGRAICLIPIAVVLASLSACSTGVTTRRPAFSPEPTTGAGDALVFHAEAVRSALADRPELLAHNSVESGRNDTLAGVRTPEQSLQDRLYRGSEWYGAPIHHPPILLFHHFGGFFGGGVHSGGGRRHSSGFFGYGGFFGFPYDPTVPILSPARERSYGYPY